MRYEKRVPKELFAKDGHYLGRPADISDKIISRRIELVKKTKNFIGKNHSLLEIGCGNGASMFLLSNDMKKCDGIDITNEHFYQFDEYKIKNNITNCSCKILDVTTNNPKDQYDRIISFEVIEHLLDEDKGLNFYYKALKKDGIIAITVPNKWWIFETHGAKLPLLPWNRIPFFSWMPRPIHEKFSNARIYTKKRINKLLEKHGFKIVSCKYVTAPMDVLPKGKIKNWLLKNIFNKNTTKIPFKATSIFVVATKK